MSLHVNLQYILKAISAAAWVVILPVTYAFSWKSPSGFGQIIKNWFGNGSGSPSMFILTVLIYLSPNILSALLFLFPPIRRYLERSNYGAVKLMMWSSQVSWCRFCLWIYISVFYIDIGSFLKTSTFSSPQRNNYKKFNFFMFSWRWLETIGVWV
jgi:hypothetical protein